MSEKRSHLVNWTIVHSGKGQGPGNLQSQCLKTRLCLVSRTRDLLQKGNPYGKKNHNREVERG